MYLVHFEPSNNVKYSALGLMQEAHTLAQLEKQSLSPLRAVLSSLLWNDQSKGSETSQFLEQAVFQLKVYRKPEEGQAYEARRAKSFFPFELMSNPSDPEIKAYYKQLARRCEQARKVGIGHILNRLPFRPSSEHYWSQKHDKWLTDRELALKESDSIYRFKGLNDDWD